MQMQRPETPPLTAANSIPQKTVEELDRERAVRRAEEKHKNNAFALSKMKTIVYVATAQWCGHCTRLKYSILMGMGMTRNDEPLNELLKLKQRKKSSDVYENELLLKKYSKLLLERGTFTLYEDNNLVIKLLETESEQEQAKNIVSLLRPSAFPSYYAVYANSEIKEFNASPPNKDSRSYSDWLDDIIGSAHMLGH